MAKRSKKPSSKETSNEPNVFGVTLGLCQVVKFHFEIPKDDPTGKNFDFKVKLEPVDNTSSSAMLLALTVDAFLTDESKKTPPAKAFTIGTITAFSFSGLDTLDKDADGNPQIPGWAHATIFSVVFGAVRGILMEKLSLTIYSDVVLPIIGMKAVAPNVPFGNVTLHGI